MSMAVAQSAGLAGETKNRRLRPPQTAPGPREEGGQATGGGEKAGRDDRTGAKGGVRGKK